MTDGLPVHSKLGASQMHRWAACPGSVALSEGIEGVPSIYAAEGTVAHAIAAECLTAGVAPMAFLGRVVQQDGVEIEVTEELLDSVEVYTRMIHTESPNPSTAIRMVEQRFHLKDIHPDLYGTADCCIYHPREKRLCVYDYKHGAGVPVEVTDNEQLKYYVLGALLTIDEPVNKLEMGIVQPRCAHPDGPVRRQRVTILDMLDFASDLLDAAKRTEDPNAPLVAGSHCRWCRAQPICPEMKRQALEAARKEFPPC